jgi:hypothetical protein
MKLLYTGANRQKQEYPHNFVSVREALYVAANTGYILDSLELHITADTDKKIAETKPAKKTQEGADGKDKAL